MIKTDQIHLIRDRVDFGDQKVVMQYSSQWSTMQVVAVTTNHSFNMNVEHSGLYHKMLAVVLSYQPNIAFQITTCILCLTFWKAVFAKFALLSSRNLQLKCLKAVQVAAVKRV